MKKIAFAGTDGRTLLSALVTATAKSDTYDQAFTGVVIRGTPSMPEFCKIMDWPVEFVATDSNSVEDYTRAIIDALKHGQVDYVIPMPEALLFEGLVDAGADTAHECVGSDSGFSQREIRHQELDVFGFLNGCLRHHVASHG